MAQDRVWKLYIENSARPPSVTWSSHDSLDSALADACALTPDHTAIRIEGPDGEQHGKDFIEREYRARRKQAYARDSLGRNEQQGIDPVGRPGTPN
jgi:hypothetical protein